jgi:YHS domain-containing protein
MPFPLLPRVRTARALLAMLWTILSAGAHAGEFFEKDGVALRGHDPVAYFTEGKPVRGSREHTADYKGTTFWFATQAHRDAFVASPERYAPQYGGYCAYGAASGYKAVTDPTAFSVVGGKLYLNYNADVQAKWSGDVTAYVRKADRRWPRVSRQTNVVE